MTDERLPKRALALVGGLAAVVAALLGVVQLDAGRKGDRAAAEATRLAVATFGELTQGGLRLNAESAIIREQFGFETEAEATAALAGGDVTSGLAGVARADTDAARRLKETWAEMIGQPLGLETLPVLQRHQEEVERRASATVARQNAALAESQAYGRRAGRASRGLLLVATAGALLTLAGSLRERRPAWMAFSVGVLVLAGGAVTGLAALVV